MPKFLINTVLLTVLYALLAAGAGEDNVHWGYVFVAALSALVCSLGSWLSPVSAAQVMSRDEALRQCRGTMAPTEWPIGPYLLPMPPDGWVWLSSTLYKLPILVSTEGIITNGDWHDGF